MSYRTKKAISGFRSHPSADHREDGRDVVEKCGAGQQKNVKGSGRDGLQVLSNKEDDRETVRGRRQRGIDSERIEKESLQLYLEAGGSAGGNVKTTAVGLLPIKL